MTVELLNVDCMEYMAGLEDNAFDLAIVDPPYGIGMGKNTCGRLRRYGSIEIADESPIHPQYFEDLERVSINQIIWGGNYFALPATRCFLIWDKQQPEDVSFASCEYAWTSFDQSAKTYYQRPQSMDFYRVHPTQKPVKLYEWLLSKYAEPGQRILDTHLGSGSSAIAAHYGGFDFVGCEIDEDYYKAAVERFDMETRQQALI